MVSRALSNGWQERQQIIAASNGKGFRKSFRVICWQRLHSFHLRYLSYNAPGLGLRLVLVGGKVLH